MLVFMGIHSCANRGGSRESGAACAEFETYRDRPFSSNLQLLELVLRRHRPPVAFDFPPSTKLLSQYLSILTVRFSSASPGR